VFTLQTLPACDEKFNDEVGNVAGFSLHAGVVAGSHERKKLERLCRYDVQAGKYKCRGRQEAVSDHQPPGSLGKAAVTHPQGQRTLSIENTVP